MRRVVGLFVFLTILTAMSHGQAYMICRLRLRANPIDVAMRYGLTYLDKTDNHNFYLYGAPSLAYIESIEPAMGMDSDVLWAEEDMEITDPESQSLYGEATRATVKKGSTLPAVGGRDTLYAQNTAFLQQVGFSPALAASAGRTVRAAVLDTGLTPLATYLWEKTVASANYVEPFSPAFDLPQGTDSDWDGIADEGTGHGSMVAGLLDQLAPQVQLVVVRIADSDGCATVWSIVKGLCFAVDQGCEVANVSFGTLYDLPAMKYFTDWCDSNDLLVVCPAGNNGIEALCYPAKLSDTISVAGLLPDNTKAPFSNYYDKCNFSAPATGISSAWWDGDWATWSGTSLASPIVAGIIADCLRRRSKPMDPHDIRDKIKDCGRDLDDTNPRFKDKLGRLVDHRRVNNKLADCYNP